MTENKEIAKILPIIALAGAAVSLIFTFLVGVSVKDIGTSYIYHYFESDTFNAISYYDGIMRHAVRSEIVMGLIFTLIGLLTVLTLTGFTCYRAIRRYVFKEEREVEKLSFCTYLAYVIFAGIFFALTNYGVSYGGNSIKTVFNAATIVGITISTVIMTGYVGLKVYVNRQALKSKLGLINVIITGGLIAILAVITGLALSQCVSFKAEGLKVSSGFMQLIVNLFTAGPLTTTLEDKLSSLVSSSITGFLAVSATAILSAALIAHLFFSLFKQRKNGTVFFAIELFFTVLILFFAVIAGDFYADILVGKDAALSLNLAVPVTVLVFAVLLFALNIAQPHILAAVGKREEKEAEHETDGDTLLEVENLSQHFVIGRDFFGRPNKTLKAVDGVSFKLKKGKTLGIVGESGCGKTTMGRTILRLYDVTGGDVWFKGRRISKLKNRDFDKLRPNMQMIFQDPYASLSPRLTVGEIIGEAVKQHKLVAKSEYHDYILQVMKMCGLQPHYFERYPHEFSGGQRQRICIARALALKPELVICDEPVSALDVSIQAQIINMLIELRKSLGLTYIFISHDLSVVKHISDEVGVMYLGTLVEYGSKDAIFENTLHPYTKALFSAVPVPDPHVKMNRIILKGDIPSPVNPPSGCKFHTRCDKCMEICGRIAPIYKEVEEGHFCACHLYNTEEDVKKLEEQYIIDCKLAEEQAAEQNKHNVMQNLWLKVKDKFKKKDKEEDDAAQE